MSNTMSETRRRILNGDDLPFEPERAQRLKAMGVRRIPPEFVYYKQIGKACIFHTDAHLRNTPLEALQMADQNARDTLAGTQQLMQDRVRTLRLTVLVLAVANVVLGALYLLGR